MGKKKPSKNKKGCSKFPKLTTCAYSFAALLTGNLETDELFQLAIFLNTTADLLVLNAQERQLCENPEDAEEIESEIILEQFE